MKDDKASHSQAVEKPTKESASSAEKSAGKLSEVQRRAAGTGKAGDTAQMHEAARAGVSGSGGALPHGDAIQSAFGRHDVSGIDAHVGGPATDASDALGATAYATGNQVAFARSPDLHTAAHEAAHVVQQQAGVALKGGFGESGDAYEQHADAVADAVVGGRSAEGLLDQMAPSPGGAPAGGGVQLYNHAPVPRTAQPPADQPHIIHTVVRGDTLWAIARANGVPLRDLIALNPHITDPDLIYPGDTIAVPTGSPGGGETPEEGPGETPEEGPGETPPDEGPGESPPGESPPGETPVDGGEQPGPHDALIAAVDASDFFTALELVAPQPNASNPETAPAIAALQAATKLDAFLTLLRDSKPYSDTQRGQLSSLYHELNYDLKKRVFEARFSVTISAIANDAGVTTDFTEAELDTLHDQAALLPGGHVEGLSTWTGLVRTTNAAVNGSYGNPDIKMDDMQDPAQFTGTFRHEIGHAVDAAMGGDSAGFRTGTAGWTRYGGPADFISAMGGYGTLPSKFHEITRLAITAYMGPGNTFQAPTATFEETLRTTIADNLPWYRNIVGDAVTDDLTEMQAHYTSSPPLATMIACQGDNNYWRFPSWNVAAGKAFFVNQWYARPYSVASATHSDLSGWPSNSSAQKAAFSDAEWFAETYSVWYSTTTPGTSHGWAGFVRTFFEGPVAALGSPAEVEGGGGGHPNVPV